MTAVTAESYPLTKYTAFGGSESSLSLSDVLAEVNPMHQGICRGGV